MLKGTIPSSCLFEGSKNLLEPSCNPQTLKIKAVCFFKISGKINPETPTHPRRNESAACVDRDCGNVLKCSKQMCGNNKTTDESGHLGCDTALLGKWFMTYQRNLDCRVHEEFTLNL
jgi:hypothetical protein